MQHKSLLLAFAVFCISQSGFSQSKIADLLHFTAVARDASNNPYQNQEIYVKIEIYRGIPLPDSIPDYCEQTKAKTNAFGEFSLEFGTNPSFLCDPFKKLKDVRWETGNKWVGISFQPGSASSPYIGIDTFQLTTVPYAFAARTAENLLHVDLSSPGNGDVLKYDEASGKWKPSPGTGSQTVQANSPLIGDGTAGNKLRLQPGSPGQVLKYDGTQWAAGTDDIGSGGVTLTPGNGGIGISGGPNNYTITNTGDLSNTNEIQSLELNGNKLGITGVASTVTLPGAQTIAPIIGDGTTSTTKIRLQDGTIKGQSLEWTGSAWAAGGEYAFVKQSDPMLNNVRKSASNPPFDVANIPALTVPATGTYMVLASLRISAMEGGDNFASIGIAKNGTSFMSDILTIAKYQTSVTVSDINGDLWDVVSLSQGDKLKLQTIVVGNGTTNYTVMNGKILIKRLE